MDQKGSTNIKVAIRVRPLIPTEQENKLKAQWNTQENIIYQIDDNGQQFGEVYSFDHIFGMNKKNLEIYNDIVKDFVISSLDGLNSTIFAYGQTSSGKTYTMLGDKKDTGIMSLAIENIFSSIENNTSRKFLIRVSYIEIYNEKINDLLDLNNKDIKIREFNPSVVGLQNVKEEFVSTRHQMYDCLKRGNLNRRIGATKANERSSRSHTIFKIIIESTLLEDGGSGCVQISNLNLVDLAGSERVAQTKATGIRLKEGGHINKSLSALGLVIKQLSDGQEFVNFRDSKLTRLLQDSIGGNSKTLIIATITVTSIEDTISTLAFAQRAKTVKNKPHVNEILTDADVSKRYAALNTQLQKKLEEQLLINQRLQRTQEENVREMTRLHQQMELLEDFQNGPQTPRKIIPKRRHTIGFSARKRLLQKTTLEELDKSGNYSEEITMFENLISKDCEEFLNVSTATTVAGLETIMEEEPLPSNKVATPERCLRVRLSALEQDYNELATFTRDEENIFNETAKKADELQQKLIQIQNELEVERDFKNRFKVREDELCSRIHELEEEIQKYKAMIHPVLNSTERTYIMDQLISLRDILSNPEFLNDSTHVTENSVLHIIEQFNNKVKTSKEIIENEILKQINNFDHGSQISLPNNLQSFNDLLNELSLFESDIPVDLINNRKKESIEHFKILITVYESLLRKNEFIKICSDRIKTLEKHLLKNDCEKEDLVKQISENNKEKETFLENTKNMEIIIENHNREIDNLNRIINEKEAIISTTKVECFHLKEEKEKVNIELLDAISRNNSSRDEFERIKKEKDEEIETLRGKIEKLTIELEEFSDCLLEKESIIDELKNNKELLELKTRIEKLSLDVTNKEQILADFENNQSKLMSENENLKEEVRNLRGSGKVKTDTYHSEIPQSTSEIENLKTLLCESENRYTSLKLELEKLKRELSTVSSHKGAQLNILKCIVAEKNQIKSDIQNNLRNFQVELDQSNKIVSKLQQFNELSDRDYNRILSENKSLECKLNLNVRELTELRNSVEKLSLEIVERDKIINKSHEANMSLETAIKNLREDLESASFENRRLIQDLQKNDDVSKSYSQKINQLQNEINLLNSQIGEKVTTLKELEKLCFELKENLQLAEKNSAAHLLEQESVKLEVDKLRSEIKNKDKIINESAKNNEIMKLQLEKSQQLCTELALEKDVLTSQIEELKKSNEKITALENEIENKAKLLANLEHKFTQELDKCRKISLENDSLQSELSTLGQKLTDAKIRLEASSLEIIEKDKVIYEYQNCNTKLKMEIEYLVKNGDKLRSENEFLKKNSESKTTEIQSLHNNINNLNTKLKNKSESESICLQLQAELTTVNHKYSEIYQHNRSLQQEISELKHNLDDLEKSLEFERQQLTHKSLENEQLKSQIEKLSSTIDNRHQTSSPENLKIQRLKQLLNNAQTENVVLKETLKDKEKLKHELSTCKMQLTLNKTKVEQYIKLNEKLNLQLQEFEHKVKEMKDCNKNDGLQLKEDSISKFRCIKEKLEQFLCSIMEQYINEQKTILCRRHSQEERDCFKNVLKDFKSSNSILKQQLNFLRSQNSFDLNEIGVQLLKSRGCFRDYFEAEKGLLQKQIDNLESSNKAYLEEIIVLKNSRQSSTSCPNCDALQTELSKLNKLINLQEETLDSLKNKNATLSKENVARLKQIANLQLQLYNEQDRKADIQYSDYLKFCEDNLKIQQKQIKVLQEQIENYKNNSMRNKQSVKVQCNLLPQQSSPNSQLKGLPVNVQKGQIFEQGISVKMCSAEVQCDILDMEKYNLIKKICRSRHQEIAALQAELNCLKMAK